MAKSVSKKDIKGVEDGGETKDPVGLKTETLRRKQEAELEVGEVKMLRLSLGGTRMEKIWNESIRG